MVATGVVRMQYLRLFGSAALVLVGACHVYETGLINHSSDASSVEPSEDASVKPSESLDMAQVASDAGARDIDAAASAVHSEMARTSDGGGQSAPSATTCRAGECWWSADIDGNCHSAGRPGPQHRPTSANAANSLPAIYLGWTQIDLGGSSDPDDARPGQWESFGLDLDGVCTNSSSCSSRKQACKAATSEIPFDGALCRDNRFARLQAMLAPVPEIGERFGLREDTFNCNLRRGTYNVIVKLSDYNGQPDDQEVRVDFYTSPGLARLPPWSCDDRDASSYPSWTAGAAWQIDQTTLTGPIMNNGELPASTVADANAFVREGYLVAELPDGAQLRLAGSSHSYRSFALTTRRSVWTGALQHQQDGTWKLDDGLVAGTTLASDLLETFHELGLCQQQGQPEQEADQNSFYELVENAVRENADMLADGRIDEGASCDALSFAIAFRAAQLTPGAATMSPERITCCPPGMTAEDCHPECGDGVVSGTEQCDRAILAGEKGACPIWCTPIDACTPQRVSGSAASCDAHCVSLPITRARAGDGCCPKDANANTDSDCSSSCGNGEVEPGETCEPKNSQTGCPSSCKNEDACMAGELTGSADSCDLACSWTRIEQCRNGDGCCPSGCDQTEDDDCHSSCGNKVLESGERCENGTSTPCPTSCDDSNTCTADTMSGSASDCSARCDHKTITEKKNNDGCCPDGANATNDSDCKPVCGNWVRELSEDCDDGNTRGGDGCSSECKTEGTGQTESTDTGAMCLSLLGNPTDACSGCVCKECDQEVVDCRGASNADEAKQCRDVFSCATAQRCFGTACYCTSGSCSSGTPDGPCRKEIEAAAHSSDPSVVVARFNDAKYPLGRVMQLTSCFTSKCSSSCTTTP